MSPFAEDVAIIRAADAIGGYVIRRAVIQIDEKQLPACYFKKAPDWAKIRRDLEAGVQIPGAVETPEVEYVIKRPQTELRFDGDFFAV